MNSQLKLFSIGNFDFKFNHILIIGILALSFSISFLIRSLPAGYGWELNEFDPFFNYRATQYIAENGISSYFSWNDELSWYPYGRDVSSNSQVILHVITALGYWISGSDDLYGFTIIFPVVMGSFSTIIIFALVRVLAGTSAGLIASLLFSVSTALTLRGMIGWFKSEPLGIFLGLSLTYLFLSSLSEKNFKVSLIKIIFSGILVTLSLSAWGGNQFFLLPIGILIITLPLIRKNKKSDLLLITCFCISSILSAMIFERPGFYFIFGLGGLTIILPTIISVINITIKNFFNHKNTKFYYIVFLILLFVFSIIVFFLVDSHVISIPTHRYLNSINPLLTTTDPLTDSISEHATTNIHQSFLLHSVLLIFSGLGAWFLLFKKNFTNFKNEFILFSLIIGIIGVYISSSFMRLGVLGDISLIILSSIGISILMRNLIKMRYNKKFVYTKQITFLFTICLLLIIPLVFPSTGTVFFNTNVPPTILNGGTIYKNSFDDWNLALEWIKNNTNEDAVIASWWDYGYWIQTKSDRATISDNSTVNAQLIKNLAKILFENPEDAWNSFQKIEADYFVLFIAGQRLGVDGQGNVPLYALIGGGDESKKYWFAKIAEVPVEKYLEADGNSGKNVFWEETFLGKIFPFKPIGYANFETQQFSQNYVNGWIGVYEKNIEYVSDPDSPFKLVYASPSFDSNIGESFITVLIYEINPSFNGLN